MARKSNPRYENLKVVTNEKDSFFFMGSLHNNTHYCQSFRTRNNIGTKDFDQFIAWVKRAEKHWIEGETQGLFIDCRVNQWTNGKMFEKKICYSFKLNESGQFEFARAWYCTFEEYDTPVGEHKFKGMIDHKTTSLEEIANFLNN